ncbi:hypothetical protein [Microbacterium sp. p3-SID336]|uniref:hypothetical protein n=1 Tax=Microbacterium sp. p3-SID336 TaxID=2916212 RepID=UPI0021A405FD|nr:hypothetical protein [Microbacterium sp. p3-SID336]MCT1477621.1 hypothetical protein [Microbacterium sp. p3-SID336]
MIRRAFHAQVQGFAGDLVLLGVATAAFVMSLSLALSIPSEAAAAPPGARESLAALLSSALAMNAAILAAIYGSFRYTIDRRDGVIAQRLMLQSRWALLLARAPTTAVGGAVVALVSLLGGRLALALALGGVPVDVGAVARTLGIGAVAALWGLGVGLLVRFHLVALFVTAMSLGVAPVLAALGVAAAAASPLLALLAAFGFDVTGVGLLPEHRLDPAVSALVAVGWVLAAVGAGGAAFVRRDVT